MSVTTTQLSKSSTLVTLPQDKRPFLLKEGGGFIFKEGGGALLIESSGTETITNLSKTANVTTTNLSKS